MRLLTAESDYLIDAGKGFAPRSIEGKGKATRWNTLLLLQTWSSRCAASKFCAAEHWAAACADYAHENDDVLVSFEDVSGSHLTALPFVNRLEQLGQAADALLHNKQLVLAADFDPRQLTLVFSSHLFGAGKTAFAGRVFRGLNAAFRGKMFYARSMGVPADASSIISAIARLVVNAAESAGVITLSTAESLRTGSLDITSVVYTVQTSLVSNESSPRAFSELFLHLDEFDLSHGSLLQAYSCLRSLDELAAYDYVWQQAFFPILCAPNMHLVVTGRVPRACHSRNAERQCASVDVSVCCLPGCIGHTA